MGAIYGHNIKKKFHSNPRKLDEHNGTVQKLKKYIVIGEHQIASGPHQ